ncbi:spore germination protein [Sporosarcina siberiensis]|uniref:Spore germination protein n=1 Tax=Sporosarcina siberiensis TaxID=1365606 RepID=A0ABW4SGI7_9BACL
MKENKKTVSVPPKLMAELAEKLKSSFDIAQIPLIIEDKEAHLFYLKTVVDGEKLQNVIIKPFFELNTIEHFEAYLNSLPNKSEVPSNEELLVELTRGFLLIAIEERFIFLELRKVNSDTVHPTLMEATIHGPQLAFSEDLATNLNIIRQNYHGASLVMNTYQLNDRSNRMIALLYDEESVNLKVLNKIKEKIELLEVPLVQSAGDLERLLTDKKYNLYPTTILTERPDRIVYNITGGKVIVMVDGSPQAIIAPVVFFDFMVSMESNYHNFWISLFTTFLGYFGLLTCLLLPSVYVAVTSYNPEILRTELALTVTGSRIGVPYPSYIEVLFMLIFMELLTEASIRLPKAVSATATTVGGLILGTAATEAALASNIMIIVVAAVAISTFVIPINELGFSIRITRIFLIIFTSLFGLNGLIVGFLLLIMLLANKDSFGEPYFKFFILAKNDEKKVNNE